MVHTVTVENSPPRTTRVIAYKHVAYVRHRASGGNKNPPLRKEVVGLSRGARRRMLRFMAECNESPSWFVTLTYPRLYPSPKMAKEDFRVWAQRLQRIVERSGRRVGILWRMETQARGAPHFHCLVWCAGSSHSSLLGCLPSSSRSRVRAAFRPLARKWERKQNASPSSFLDWLGTLSATWYDRIERFACGDTTVLANCVDLKRVTNYRGAAAYVGKYLAKASSEPFCDSETGEILPLGRVWGTRGDTGLCDRRVLGLLKLPPAGNPESWLRDCWRALGLSWGANAEAEGWASYTVFLTGEGFWDFLDWLLRNGITDCERRVTLSLPPPDS